MAASREPSGPTALPAHPRAQDILEDRQEESQAGTTEPQRHAGLAPVFGSGPVLAAPSQTALVSHRRRPRRGHGVMTTAIIPPSYSGRDGHARGRSRRVRRGGPSARLTAPGRRGAAPAPGLELARDGQKHGDGGQGDAGGEHGEHFRWVLHATVAPGPRPRGARCRESTPCVAAMHARGRPTGSPWRSSRGGWGGAARGGRRRWRAPSGTDVVADRTGPDRVGVEGAAVGGRGGCETLSLRRDSETRIDLPGRKRPAPQSVAARGGARWGRLGLSVAGEFRRRG